ncbi:MAG: hypothetical protein GKS07_07355 [Nitrosopumilus sp.]|nr:MAG: hypothetical protein GKS07_07355 [Nitrosopumilus sp.]
MSQLTEVKPSLLAYNLAETIALEELDGEKSITLKENYIRLIDPLQIDGVPKEKISAMGKQIIIERKKLKLIAKGMDVEEVTVGSWWRDVARQQGCTDSKYASTEVTEPAPENTSSKPKNPNIRFIDYLKRTKEICDKGIDMFSESEEIESIMTPKEFEMLCHEWESVLDIGKSSFDKKTNAPINTHNIVFIEVVTSSSINYAGKTIQEAKLVEYEKLGKFLTSKQIGYLQEGTVPKLLPLFKPDSRDAAIFQGNYGIACVFCNSWRVVEKSTNEGNLHCYECDRGFNGRTVPKCKTCQILLYKENLLYIVKKGKCPNENCKREIVLPKELSDYAQS